MKTPTPARDLAAWVHFLSETDLPVLKATARELDQLRETPDRMDARSLAQTLGHDPMMTVKLLRRVQQHRLHGRRTDVVGTEQALMVLGLEGFFRDVPARPLVDEVLAANPRALLALLKVVRRAQRASYWAMDWAARLQDLHFEEVRIAALLHDLAEILMWSYAPREMLAIEAKQEKDRSLRSREVQVAVFGFPLADLQRALAREWGLPHLILRLMDSTSQGDARIRNVALAVNLARHAAHGWDDAALPDDYREIAVLLRIAPEAVPAMVGAGAAA